ncbi:myosin heavy chain kinase c-like protein [Novymonas esmeraldas]|uniref:Myosin heavy chain kinase c-like protein n=1 Tax=Novymonas esmeraldas TaxID=1808958 RepID=A0AAW0F1F5_9TRYP
MTDLLGGLHSASSSTLTVSGNANCAVSRRMGSSPLRPREETASLRSSIAFASAAASGGPSPPLPPSQHQSTDQPLRHKSDARHRTSRNSSPRSPNTSRSGGLPPPLSSLPLLPLLAGALGSRKDLFTEFAVPSTPMTNGQHQGHGISSSSTEAAQPATPQGGGGSGAGGGIHGGGSRHVPSSRSSFTRAALGGSSGGGGGGGAVAGSLVGSPSAKELSSSNLRGGLLPDAVSLIGSSATPTSRSAARLRRGSARGCLYDEDVSGGMGSDGGGGDGAASQVQLPILTCSLPSVTSSFPGRHLAAVMPEPGVTAAASVLSPQSCSSSHTSMRHDDEGPRLAPMTVVVTEASTAVGQPPRAPFAPSLPASTPVRSAAVAATAKSSPSAASSPLSSRRITEAQMGSDADSVETEERQATPLEESDRDVAGGGGPTSIFTAAPVLLTGGAAPAVLAEDAMGLGSSHTSAALGVTAGAVGAASSTTLLVVGGSTAASPLASGGGGGYTRFGAAMAESGEYGPGPTRPATGERTSGPKNSSLQSLDFDGCATAARGATGQQRPGDSGDEEDDARHPKRAKRRLKKALRAKRGSRQGSGAAGAAAMGAVAAAAAAHKSDSAIARKRERKRQLKHEKMRAMTSEERRQFRADHQRRRAAKKAMRAPQAASSPKNTHGGRGSTKDQDEAHSARHRHSSRPHAAPSPLPSPTTSGPGQPSPEPPQPLPGSAAPTHPSASPPPQASPPLVTSPLVPSLADGTSLEDLAATLSPQLLANTCRTSSANAPVDGSSALLNALHHVRRCTSASGGGPIPPSAALPSKALSSTPAPFRRRFLSGGVGTTPQSPPAGRANSFLYLASSSPAKVQGQESAAQLEGHDFDAADGIDVVHGAGGDEGSESGEGHLLRQRTMYGSGAVIRVGPEGAPHAGGGGGALAPHPPAAAAGSGAAAILELKQKQEQSPRRQVSPAPEHGAQLPAVLASVAAGEGGDVGAAEESGVSSLTATPSSRGPQGLGESSLPPPPPPRGAEASHSVAPDPHDSRTDEAPTGPSRTEATAAVAVSVSSASYYSSYSRSRGRDERRATNASELDGRGGGAAADDGAPAAARPGAGLKAAAAAAPAARRPRRSPSSSCSSFRSRSSDEESADGSSAYSYSSYSSSGSLVPEVLQLADGCSAPPPAAAFSDLKFRYSCVAQLRSYAEPAVIHEWNLAEGCWGSVETTVVLSPQPFSQGNMRASYFMIDMSRLNCLLVAKRYLKTTVADDQYFDDVSMHSIAGHWARVFNTMHPPKKVRFVPAAVLMLPRRTPPLILAMEPQLTGKFVKYNNNCGYVRRKARWTPQAFSHFTYHASEHELMVVDIQGVDDYYTDPQILSPDGEGYGRGNLGKDGIRRFLESHKCNEVCRAVGLPPLQRTAKGVVIDPLASSGSARGSAGPGTPSAAERLVNAGTPSAPGLKEERLPPKAFTLARRASSTNMQVPDHHHHHHQHHVSGVNGGHAQRPPSEAAVPMLSPAPPPRQALLAGSSGLSSPVPMAAMPASLTPSALPLRVGPPQNYGVKYVRYPRQALIRPQSQYFTSNVAGGLMSVPQQGSGVPGGYNGGSTATQAATSSGEHSGGSKSGTPLGNGSMTGASVATGGAGLSIQSPAPMAVPLLRPPAGGGRPGYAAAQQSGSPDGLHLSGAQRSGDGGAVPHAGPAHPPQLRPVGTPSMVVGGGGMPVFYPHPPSGTGAAGTPTGQRVSQHSSSNAMVPTIQSTEEVPILHQPGSRRHSFSRRPVFSAVEEMAVVSFRSRLQPPHHRRTPH